MLRVGIVGERMYGYSSARREYAPHFKVARIHKPHKVFHYDIDTILVEVAVVAETEKIQLQALALHHILARYVAYDYLGEIRLSGLRAKARKLRASKGDEIFVVLMLVLECFKHLRSILVRIACGGVAQERHALQF